MQQSQLKKPEPGTLEALAEALAVRVSQKHSGGRAFQVIQPIKRAEQIFDSVTRDHIYRRINFLKRTYGLAFLIDQATFNRPSIECLDDTELAKLLEDMEKARECIADDVSFEHAGLIRANQIPGIADL